MHDPEETRFILIYFKPTTDQPNQMEADGFKCYYLFDQDQKVTLPASVFRLVRLLNKESVDLIHAHNRSCIVCAVWSALFFPHIRVLAHVHSFNLVRTLKRKLFYRILGWRIDHMAGCSDSTTSFLQEAVKGVPAKKMSTICNSINISRFSTPTVEADTIRSEWSLTSDHFVFLSIGRLSEEKGLVHLISSFQTIHKQHPQTRLLIAGDGPQKEALQQLISRSQLNGAVHLAGFRSDINNLLCAADCFVLPSLKEPFGLVVLESIAARCPVIATDSGGVNEILSSPEYGILIPPGSEDALVKAMTKILEMPTEQRRSQTEQALQVFDRFSHKVAVEYTETLYTDILKNSK